MKEIGNQYSKDDTMDKTGFRKRARLHQSKYRAEVLNVDYCRDEGDDYGNRLSKDDGLKGLNFYNGFSIFDEVQKRNKNKYDKGLHSDMLRSEHTPFNLFVPFRQDKVFATKVFNDFFDNTIESIYISDDFNKFIEYAPSPRKKYLNDGTSFDTYIEYTHKDGGKGIIGIEVKYTEHEYPLKKGSKEEAYVELECSPYYKISEQSGIYKPNSFSELKSDLLRQIWRNHLLGESILIADSSEFKYFTSLTIFPSGNTHFVETSKKYIELLHNNDKKFLPVTYEQFLSSCRKHCPTSKDFFDWLDYLTQRYIVA